MKSDMDLIVLEKTGFDSLKRSNRIVNRLIVVLQLC